MTVRDVVCISAGEIVLALTFGLGVLVGISLQQRKDSRNDHSNEGA